MNTIKALPNVLSVSRIVLSLALPLAESLPLFAVCYIVCGLTDVLDGYLARRFGWQTDLGAKLDSLGDLAFWAVVLYLLYRRTNVYSLPVLLGIGVVALVRLANLVITKQKFRQWGMLHSLGNKLTGLALYFWVPDRFSLWHIAVGSMVPGFWVGAAVRRGGNGYSATQNAI